MFKALWKFLLAVALGVVACSASASFAPSGGATFTSGNYPNNVFNSPDDACTYAMQQGAAANGVGVGTEGPTGGSWPDWTQIGSAQCTFSYSSGATRTANIIASIQPGSCPSNSTGTTSCTCNTGFDQSGSSCVPHTSACTPNQGKPVQLRVTVGYTRTPDDNDTKAVGPTFAPWAGASVCSGGCTMDYSTTDKAWISQSPTSTGLYRNSVDVTYVNSGKECTASPSTNPADQAIDPTAAIPPCPGAVGSVNNVVGCYGTASAPIVTTNKPTPAPAPVAGNPPAGSIPSSGDGSAASPTPATGNGGPAGGPAAAAVGGKGGTGGGTASGTGTTGAAGSGQTPTPCGAPGQAECAVKVDEAGTPTNGSVMESAIAALDINRSNAADAITGAGSIQAPSWNFGFSLPSGCSAYATGIRNTIINPCQWQSTIWDLMSMIWAAVTAFCIIGMVGRTIRES